LPVDGRALRPVRKPLNILYGVDETPPLAVTLLSGLQQVGLMAVFLLFPLLVGREAGLHDVEIINLLSLSMVGMAVGAILPALRKGPVGAGFLCPGVFTAAYLGPSLLAARSGGLALVFGMTIFGGCVGAALSQVLRRLRPLFPPELAGFVVMLLAVTIGSIGMRYALGIKISRPVEAEELVVAALSLTTMVGLNVWTRGYLKLFCALIGMGVGYAAAALLGVLHGREFELVNAAPGVAFPPVGRFGWSFDLSLVPAFAVAALAACLKTVGNITTCQKINDADWVRPDMRLIGRGVLADALTSVAAGIVGTTGVNSSPSAVGLSGATGVTSRRVAYAIAAIFLVLALLPKAGALLAIMPQPVMGATLLFSASYVFVNGLEIVSARLLDARRTFVIGLSFMIGLAVDFFPDYFIGLPAGLHPLTSSSLVLGMLSAVVLNIAFRIGLRRTQGLVIDPMHVDPSTIESFMETQGAAWGARRDVIDRAAFNLQQSIETLVSSEVARGPLDVEASFDEFNLDVRVSYDGPPLELPEQRPSNEEIMASDEGERKLAGFMLRQFADRVAATHKGDRSTVLFHFDH